jgi:hypothetical protein
VPDRVSSVILNFEEIAATLVQLLLRKFSTYPSFHTVSTIKSREQMLKLYNSNLLLRPYITQSISAFVLFGAGDVLSQQAIEGKGRDHDFMRTARLSCYGGLVFAPTITKWYSLLERIQMSNRVKSEPLLSVGSVPQLADPAVSFFK